MKAMDLERQRWQEHLERQRLEAEQVARQARLERMKAQQEKQAVFSREIVDQILSDAGYNGYRLKLEEYEGEWWLENYTKGWGWNRIGSLGFQQGQATGVYKTFAGALRRIKKELGE